MRLSHTPFVFWEQGITKGTPFTLWAEIDTVSKAGGNKSRGIVRGIASSEAVDSDGEIILQKGIDWSWFLGHGFISLEHPLGIDNIIGAPIKVEPAIVKGRPATAITAELFLDDPVGRKVYQKAKLLKKCGTDRKLGFSIEGRAIKRDNNTITKSKVISVAVSAVPKNPHTFFEPIAASMNGMSREDLMTIRLLRQLPGLTWKQGHAVISELKAKLGKTRR